MLRRRPTRKYRLPSRSFGHLHFTSRLGTQRNVSPRFWGELRLYILMTFMVYFIHSPSVLRDKILAWIAKTEKKPKITILKTSEGLRFAYGKVRPVFPYCRIYLKMTLMDWFKQIQLNYLSHVPYSLRQNFRRFSLRCFFLHFGLHSEKPKIFV